MKRQGVSADAGLGGFLGKPLPVAPLGIGKDWRVADGAGRKRPEMHLMG
ncbi:MAG: hypothetical protein WBC93_05795 [Sulfitobacter sp.]